MRVLILKEWKQLASIGWLWAGLILMGSLSLLLSKRIDEESYHAMCDSYCYAGTDLNVGFILTVLLLITAYSLYPREYDDATIDFLHALPVRKSTIFIAKFLAAWSLVAALTILSFAIDAAMMAFNTQSLEGVFYSRVHLMFMAREVIFAFIILSHGISLSCFRTPGLVLYGIYLFGVMYLEHLYGDAGIANVFNVLRNDYFGSDLQYAWKPMMVHSAIAFVLLVVSYRYWSRKEPTGAGKDVSGMRLLWLARLGGAVVFVLVGLFMLQMIGTRTGTTDTLGTTSRSTAHYRFVFPEGSQSTADFLVGHADQDYQHLIELLNSDQTPLIDADMTAEVAHVPGLAKWKKIRMDISGQYDDETYRRILSHETTHVFQSVVSNNALKRNYGGTRFFIEGMAQHMSFQIAPDQESRTSNWRLAAIAWKRQNITFEDMLSNASFTEKYNEELYYSLGDIWTDALARTCGMDILGDLLRSAVRPKAPVDPSPITFWRDVLQHNGCELEVVNVNWRKQMERLLASDSAREFPELIEIRFSSDPDTTDFKGLAKLKMADNGILPARFRIKIRSEAILSRGLDAVFPGRLVEGQGEPKVEYIVPLSALAGRKRFSFQMGYVPTVGSRVYFEPWQKGTIRPTD